MLGQHEQNTWFLITTFKKQKKVYKNKNLRLSKGSNSSSFNRGNLGYQGTYRVDSVGMLDFGRSIQIN